jgi:hypothetical protein
MRFCPLVSGNDDPESLNSEYRTAREIGKVRLGELHLFLRAGMKTYYIPYREVRRCFRRVQLISARMCCGRGNFEVENLVVCGENDEELMQVQLPGAKAAKILMEELQARIPEAEFGKPAANGE